ncbi:unnamed protein product [Absidia cylindrospora]
MTKSVGNNKDIWLRPYHGYAKPEESTAAPTPPTPSAAPAPLALKLCPHCAYYYYYYYYYQCHGLQIWQCPHI